VLAYGPQNSQDQSSTLDWISKENSLFLENIQYNMQFGGKSGIFGEKSGISGKKSGIDTFDPARVRDNWFWKRFKNPHKQILP
jgi:hypothetical protein